MLPCTGLDNRNVTVDHNGRDVKRYQNRHQKCCHIPQQVAEMLPEIRQTKQKKSQLDYIRIESRTLTINIREQLGKNVNIHQSRQDKWYHIAEEIAEMLPYNRIHSRNANMPHKRQQECYHIATRIGSRNDTIYQNASRKCYHIPQKKAEIIQCIIMAEMLPHIIIGGDSRNFPIYQHRLQK